MPSPSDVAWQVGVLTPTSDDMASLKAEPHEVKVEVPGMPPLCLSYYVLVPNKEFLDDEVLGDDTFWELTREPFDEEREAACAAKELRAKKNNAATSTQRAETGDPGSPASEPSGDEEEESLTCIPEVCYLS